VSCPEITIQIKKKKGEKYDKKKTGYIWSEWQFTGEKYTSIKQIGILSVQFF
jgi:hypothetical protein